MTPQEEENEFPPVSKFEATPTSGAGSGNKKSSHPMKLVDLGAAAAFASQAAAESQKKEAVTNSQQPPSGGDIFGDFAAPPASSSQPPPSGSQGMEQYTAYE